MYASIDIGSNSALLLVGELEGSEVKVIHERAEVTSLGKNLDESKLFEEASMEATFLALSSYLELILEFNIRPCDVIVTATEASRVAKNSKDFFRKVEDKLGFKTHIISAEGEAYFTARGVSMGEKELDDFTIVDIGGASTELIHFDKNLEKIKNFVSLKMGSARASDWISKGECSQKMNQALVNVSKTDFSKQRFVWVAGTVTSIAAVSLGLLKYDSSKVHGSEVELAKLWNLRETMLELEPQEVLEKYPVLGKRSESIKGGLELVSFLMEFFDQKSFRVSNFGLRHGTLGLGRIDERFLKE